MPQSTGIYNQRSASVAGGSEVAASSFDGTGGVAYNTALPATPGVTNFITHFSITAAQVSTVVTGQVQLTGVIDGPYYYYFCETVTAGGYLDMWFNPPLPATGQNVAITVVMPTISGGSTSAVVIQGWQQ